ncbi:MAG: Gfo/Idh/MocA family oxidoreductase [Planctomycetes bacterium]|nr:Gfo/Idh/MocA family oxidoreductase [Planctomycetota bacterium]
MNPLRVAVVGVGHLGKEHARVYRDIEGVELVAVADIDADTARQVAKKNRTEAVFDYRSLVGRMDAVSVAVPTTAHHEVAGFFLDRGVHVLVEKPMTRTAAEAADLVARAARSRRKLAVGHIERFNPAVQAVQRMGIEPKYIESHRISPFPSRSADVGVVLDVLIHDLDIILSFVRAPIERIDALGIGVLGELEDIANARITFADGCVANATASRVSLKRERKIRIFAENVYISLDYEARRAKLYRKSPELTLERLNVQRLDPRALKDLKDLIFGKLVTIEDVKMDEHEPLAKELESFVDAVREDRPPAVSGEDGLRVVETAEAIVGKIREHLTRHGRGPTGDKRT